LDAKYGDTGSGTGGRRRRMVSGRSASGRRPSSRAVLVFEVVLIDVEPYEI
jgi:hypothetical protein